MLPGFMGVPNDPIIDWWWKVDLSESGLSQSWEGRDAITMGISNQTYCINLTVLSTNGYISSISSNLSGMPDYIPPQANFTAVYRNGSSPQVVAFVDQSAGLTNLTYRWDFGDGTGISTERNPEHTYLNRSQSYPVTLTVTDTLGGSSILNQSDYISVGQSLYPQAGFTFTPSYGEWPLNVTFIDQSILDPKNSSEVMYYWDFWRWECEQ